MKTDGPHLTIENITPTPEDIVVGGYVYRMAKCGGGSNLWGPCEVCNQPADSIYYLVQLRPYTRHDGKPGLTAFNCFAKFGHKECLATLAI